MIVLIGANASIVQELVLSIPDEEFLLVGRSKPAWMSNNIESKIKFVETDYLSIDFLIERKSELQDITVVFTGVSAESGLILNLDSQKFMEDLDRNLNFALKVCQAVLPKMIRDEFGRFIFLGSKEASRGTAGAATYSVIKQAHIGLSRTLGIEYAKFGVTSNVVQLGLLPGGSRTRIRNSKELSQLKARIPTTAELNVIDIAEMIKLLIKVEGINGAVVDLDQGVR